MRTGLPVPAVQSRTPFRLIRFLGPVLAVVAIVIAVIDVHANSPAPLRIFCIPILVLTPGVALTTLLLGAVRPLAYPLEDPAPADRRADPAVRIPLSALLGILVCLFCTLALHILGIQITATHLALGVGVTSVILVVGAARRRTMIDSGARGPTGRASTNTSRTHRALRVLTAAVCSSAVLASAVIAGRAVQPHHDDRFTSLAFVDSKPYAAERHVVAAGTPVRLNWVVRGFGYHFTGGPFSVEVRVDGTPVEDVAVDFGPVTGPDLPGATGAMTGAVTFPAPATPGRHSVQVGLSPVSQIGTDLPPVGFLTTFVQVEG